MLPKAARTVDSRLVRHTEQILNIKRDVNAAFADVHYHVRILYAGFICSLVVLLLCPVLFW